MRKWVMETWRKSLARRGLLLASPVALLVLLGFWRYGTQPPVQYYTAKVEKGDIAQMVTATGTINAVTTVQVGSQVSGTLSQILVDFNSRVKKDQVIAQIDPAILRARLLQAEADLENAKANMKSLEAQIETQRADVQAAAASRDRAQAQLNEAKLNLNRTAELFGQGIVAEAQRDTVQANYDAAVASLRVAEAQVEQARARLKASQAQLEQARAQMAQRRAAAELARVDLGHTTIQAPIDGTVIARNVDVGQTVAASFQAPTLFIIAQDLTKMLVYAKTDEADVGKIKVGAMATFRVDSFPREMFRGRVLQVRMNATTVQNVVTYDTIIEFDNPEQRLFPGMTAYVTIPVAWANQVVKLPNGAMRFKPDLDKEQLKALYEKHKIPWEDPEARRLGGPGGMPGGFVRRSEGGGPGSNSAGGTPRGGEFGAERAGSADGESSRPRRMMGGPREQWGVVWKIGPGKELIPVRVRLGVTDYTFTELKEGEIKEGVELVIGQSSGRSPTAQQARPPFAGPGGSPGGFGRRM